MHTYWRLNSDIACATIHLPKAHLVLWPEVCHTIISSDSIGYPCTRTNGESSTTKHRLLHASGPYPIPPPDNPNGVGKRVKLRHLSCRISMTFRVLKRSVLGIICWSRKTITVEGSVALFYPAAGLVDQLLTERMMCPMRRRLVKLMRRRFA
ncbi:methionine S-methyltransferase [Dorcoceras hygrometricum]|uniref:Methionine S-methyltransferase n=1 Tax=Dorcoceras hygrometricum TaxID=472368 RepID=A0A2Z7B831_9LAMI|nr:methionine S-methyltransferase [Dorcoceras hygrometricum]